MSWSFTVPPTAKDLFAKAVDDASPGSSNPEAAEDVALAKDAIKSFADRLQGPKLKASASGHRSSAQGSHNGISVNVSEAS